jgi:hypothetical protein
MRKIVLISLFIISKSSIAATICTDQCGVKPYTAAGSAYWNECIDKCSAPSKLKLVEQKLSKCLEEKQILEEKESKVYSSLARDIKKVESKDSTTNNTSATAK